MKHRKQQWQDDPATDDQLTLIAKIHRGVLPPTLTKGEASALIERSITEQAQLSPMTAGQRSFIDDLWGVVYPEMSSQQASSYIDYLLERLPITSCCGREYQRHNDDCPNCGRRISSFGVGKRPCPSTIFKAKGFFAKLFGG
jgi:hypothetical protein